MCTAATYKTNDFYFGRTLDYESSYGEEIVIMPRGFQLKFVNMGIIENHYAVIGILVLVHKVSGSSYSFMLLIWVCFQPFKVGVRKEYPFLDLTAFGVVIGSLVYQLTVHVEFVHLFSSYYNIFRR